MTQHTRLQREIQETHQHVELKDYIRILRQRWMVIVGFVLVSAIAAGAVSLLTTPQYKATTRLFVSAVSNTDSISDVNSGNTFIQQRVQSYAEAIGTASVLEPVIRSLGLDQTVAELAENVSSAAPLNTVLLEISVTDADPTTAAAIANAIGEQLPIIVDEIEKPDATGDSPVRISTLQPAVVPLSPDSPNLRLNIALGLLLGLALGVGVAVLIEVLDTKIRGTRDIELLTDVSIVGGISYDPDAPKHPLVVRADPKGPRAESFRTLRTNVQFVTIDRRSSFVITSSLPGEGKSTTAANLAITMAQSGSKVLLIDADLRRPKLAEYLGLEGAVGLTDLLIGRVELDDVVQQWGEGNLFVLPAGQVPPNPSELLGSRRMVELLAQMEEHYDYVIFDSPPLLPVTDAAILSRLTGGAIIVAAAGRTLRTQFSGALKALENVDAPVLGVILTMLPTKGPDSYGYGQYSYAYGYYTSESTLDTESAHDAVTAPVESALKSSSPRESPSSAASQAAYESTRRPQP